MEIHYKTTMWCKITLPETVNKEEIIKQLEKGVEPENLDFEDPHFVSEYETFYETETFLTPEENKGYSTIELIENTPNKLGTQVVWENGQ